MRHGAPPARPRRAHLRQRRGRARPAPDDRPRAERRRQDEPARGAVRRAAPGARAGPATTARSSASTRRRCASRSTSRPRTGSTSSRSATSPSQPRRMTADGAPVERIARRRRSARWSASSCPTASSSSRARRRGAARTSTRSSRRCGRRARPRAARTPRRSRSATRCSARVRAGAASRASLQTWDLELGRHALALRDDRARAAELVAPGVAGDRARSSASRARPSCATGRGPAPRRAEEFAAELAERARLRPRARVHRPRAASRRPRAARATGASCAPTARRASSGSRCWRCCWPSATCSPTCASDPPLLLLDDVMSELDAERRERLVARVTRVGQVVVTTTDLAHVPDADGSGVVRLAVADGAVRRGGGARHERRPPAAATRRRRRPRARRPARAGVDAGRRAARLGRGRRGGARGRRDARPAEARGTPHRDLLERRLGAGARPHGDRAWWSA